MSASRQSSNLTLPVFFATCAGLILIGLGGAPPIAGDVPAAAARLNLTPLTHQAEAKAREVDRRFKEAAVMLHAKQFDHALTSLHRVLELNPQMPEAHVNMGYALLGLKRHTAARDFFAGAIELRPAQANAYYGLALALDALDDRAGALGAMRTYVHLAKADDPFVRKGRAALWEWQSASDKSKTGKQAASLQAGRNAESTRSQGK